MRSGLRNSIFLLLVIFSTSFADSGGVISQNPGVVSGGGSGSGIKPAPQSGSTVIQIPSQDVAFFKGEARVRSKVDKLLITVGEIISYQMEVEIPRGYEVAIPPPGAQLGEFLIRKYDFPEPEVKGEHLIYRFKFQITAYTTEELSIPQVPVIIQKDKQIVRVILSEEIRINVVPTTSPEDMEIKDIAGPVSVKFEYKSLLIAGLILFFIVAMTILAIYIRRRIREKKTEMPAPLPEPEELALKELDELTAEGLLEKGEMDRYYTRLSEIIRRYLGLRFQIYALEFTTSEIMKSLRGKMLEHLVYQLIREFLEECDLVKFARFIPELKSQKEMMGKARRIIEGTRPVSETEVRKAVAGVS